MRKVFIAIMMISAPLALAACGEQAAEPEDTIVAEEMVVEEPPVDATAPVTENAVDEKIDGADNSGDDKIDSAKADDATDSTPTTQEGAEVK